MVFDNTWVMHLELKGGRTISPQMDQHFQKIQSRRDHFSANFGPPDQNFQQIKIFMTGHNQVVLHTPNYINWI